MKFVLFLILLTGGNGCNVSKLNNAFTETFFFLGLFRSASTSTPSIPSSTKEITAFNFITPVATGTISGNTITIQVPAGTDITALTPSITITGKSVSPASGVTRDFTNPVVYTVTAADSSTATYTATVIAAVAITGFSFTTPAVTGTISGTGITVFVPVGTNLNCMTPSITFTGTSVSPASGVVQNFTNPVSYTVTDANSNTVTYTVTVMELTAKSITSFRYTAPGAIGTFSAGNNIAVSVPFGTDVTTLSPSIAILGASISPASGVVQDFTAPVLYTVTAADSSTNTYTVTVTVLPNTANAITTFQFTNPAILGSIVGNNINITVPNGTVITSLAPDIIITGVSLSPASGVPQDFTGPVAYTVTAGDTSTNVYTVTVTVSPNPNAALVNGIFFSGTVTNVGTASTATLSAPVNFSKSFVYCGFQIQSSNSNAFPSCQLSNPTTVDIKTGAASTSLANWFLVEFAFGVNVQRGNTAFTTTDLIMDIPIATIDPTKTFVLAYSRTTDASSSQDEMRLVKASLTSGSNLRLERQLAVTSVTVEWQIVEFSSANVQSGLTTINAASTNATAAISAVNLAKTFLFFSYNGGVGISGAETDLYTRGTFSNSTTVSFNRIGTSSTVDISWFAVEMPDVNVQKGTTTMVGGSGTSVTAALGPAVNTGKTMIVWSNDTQTGNSAISTADSGTYSSQFLNTTTIQFDRFNDEANSANLDWFTIEFQ